MWGRFADPEPNQPDSCQQGQGGSGARGAWASQDAAESRLALLHRVQISLIIFRWKNWGFGDRENVRRRRRSFWRLSLIMDHQ